MKKVMLLAIGIHISSLVALFDYDRAVHLAQKEAWSDAGQLFNDLIVNNADRPDMLYDAGYVAFNKEDYKQSKAYFEAAAQNEKSSRILKEQAYFNKGNAHLALQEFKEALLSYEQTLMLNPDNELAKHNHEVVKKMLDEQRKQQQNQQNEQNEQQEDQQQNQQQQHQQDKQKDDQNDSNGTDNTDEKQENSDKTSTSKGGSEGSQQSEEGQDNEQQDSDDERFDQERDKQDKQKNGPDQEQRNSQQQNKQRGDNSRSDQGSKGNEKNKQQEQNIDHQDSSEMQEDVQQQQNDTQEQEKAQELQPAQEQQTLDPKLEQVLGKRSDRDAQLNKQLVRALVNQEMKGQHGQNCW